MELLDGPEDNSQHKNNSSSSNHKKKRKQRRNKGNDVTPSLILKGKVLAISTCDQDSEEEETPAVPHSYKTVHQLCIDLGATVSSQVHSRVFAVLCTPMAVQRCTQRVRKVLQKQRSQIGLIHVQWLYDCQTEQKCIDWKPYSLNEMGQESLILYEENRKRTYSNLNQDEEDDDADIQDSDRKRKRIEMTEEVTIALDCCCVCHDTDRDDCPYCVDCNVTLAKKRTAN